MATVNMTNACIGEASRADRQHINACTLGRQQAVLKAAPECFACFSVFFALVCDGRGLHAAFTEGEDSLKVLD